MPPKDRNLKSVLGTISENVRKTLVKSRPKADFDMLVCGGAPGIGKTRFGKELFNYLQNHWELPHPWTREQVYLKYLYMDFGNGIQLVREDEGITDPSVIMGLRMAYCYFIEEQYSLTFETFRSLVREHMNLFTISGALEAISKHIGVKREQQLFLFLHIDEFQNIDKWGQDTGKDKATFFKDMVRSLATFMHSSATTTFIQTFLSGTAPRAFVKIQEPTSVSFRFIE
ncbi:hypothetical protein BGX34_007750, partial [Mortierella sp. NVP85]